MHIYNETTYLNVAEYECESGYYMTGNSTRICTYTGQWGDDTPSCVEIGTV